MEIHSKAFSHLWTLAVEEQFYLFWPLIVFSCNDRNISKICMLMILGAFWFRSVVLLEVLDLPKSAAYQFTIARFDALAMGGILALAVRDKYYLNLA